MALTKEQEAVYRAATKADERFSAELSRLYGKRAGDMRYRPHLWTDRALKSAALRARRATDRWLKIMRSFRESNPSRSRVDSDLTHKLYVFALDSAALAPQRAGAIRLANSSSLDEKAALDVYLNFARFAADEFKHEYGPASFNAATLKEVAHKLMKFHRERNPSRRSIHTAKWDRCVQDVKARGGAASPEAVCASALGERGSVKAGHRRRNPIPGGLNADTVYVGQRVTYAGYPGTVKRLLEDTRHGKAIMVEVQLKGGSVAVSASYLLPYTGERVKLRTDNPSGFELEKTTRLYFMVHAHPHKGGGERLWLTPSGTLSADKGKGARYTSIEVAVARAKAFLKKHRVARKYRFDVCMSD